MKMVFFSRVLSFFSFLVVSIKHFHQRSPQCVRVAACRGGRRRNHGWACGKRNLFGRAGLRETYD